MDEQIDVDGATIRDRAVILWLHAMSLLTTRYIQLMARFLAARRRRRQMLLDHSTTNIIRTGSQLAAHLHGERYFGLRRSIWRKERHSTFWEDRVPNHFTPADWVQHFRMGAKSFRILCDLVEPYMQPKDNPVTNVIPTDKRVAMAVYKLANCTVRCKAIGDLFGVHKATVSGFVFRFCDALVQMQDSFIQLPNADEATEISQRILLKCGLPQFFGAIGSTHVPIMQPKQGAPDFVTISGWSSYVLQAIVDDRYLFRHVNCTVPGSASNAEALEEMCVYQNPELLPQKSMIICGQVVPLMLAGDQSYPSNSWLLTGYEESSTSSSVKSFNKQLNLVSAISEDAFCRLKGRWNILCKPVEVSSEKVPNFISACCCLHNFCEVQGEPYSTDWEANTKDFVGPHQHALDWKAGDRSTRIAGDYRAALTSYLDNQTSGNEDT